MGDLSVPPLLVAAHGADADHTVAFGRLLARALDSQLVLATAYRMEAAGVAGRPLAGSPAMRAFESARDEVDELAGADRDAERRVIPAADIATALLDEARRLGAMALVLGADAEGHVLREVVQHAVCPVGVLPHGAHARPLETIGVAYDGSVGSRMALAAARALAERTGARLDLLGAGRDVSTRTDVERALHFEQLAADPGVAIESHVLRGDPVRELLSATQRLDLLACGSRGHGLLRQAVFGSVSRSLVQAAFCPVLLTPVHARPRPGLALGVTTADC